MEALARVIRDFDPVSYEALERQVRSRFAIMSEGLPGPSLIPLNDREIIKPSCVEVFQRRLRFPRAAVHDKDHRICFVGSVNIDPLVDASDWDKLALGDRAGPLPMRAPP
jgi:hypothetical protein